MSMGFAEDVSARIGRVGDAREVIAVEVSERSRWGLLVIYYKGIDRFRNVFKLMEVYSANA